MAQDFQRNNCFVQKKVESHFAVDVAEGSGVDQLDITSDDYLLGNLPPDCIITDSYIHVVTVSDAATSAVATLGTTEGGSEILSAGDLTTAGKQGTAAADSLTTTGVPIYLGLTYTGAATLVGEYIIVVEYMEYTRNNGEFTRIDDSLI